MKVITTAKVTVETKSGLAEVHADMAINWHTAQPIYKIKYKSLVFDSCWDYDYFYSSAHAFRLKIVNADEFKTKIEELINEINAYSRQEINRLRMDEA